MISGITQIGIVKNNFNEPEQSDLIKTEESVIRIFDDFAEGLLRIEDSEYIDILFSPFLGPIFIPVPYI